jgi:hypothetical protein
MTFGLLPYRRATLSQSAACVDAKAPPHAGERTGIGRDGVKGGKVAAQRYVALDCGRRLAWPAQYLLQLGHILRICIVVSSIVHPSDALTSAVAAGGFRPRSKAAAKGSLAGVLVVTWAHIAPSCRPPAPACCAIRKQMQPHYRDRHRCLGHGAADQHGGQVVGSRNQPADYLVIHCVLRTVRVPS